MGIFHYMTGIADATQASFGEDSRLGKLG